MRVGRWIAGPALLAILAALAIGQNRGVAPAPPPRAGAPFDPTGYWVSQIVDEWRFRVTPQKGDILYLPLNAAARRAANAWDPAKDEAGGNACKAYGAVGVMQRPGRLRITWENDTTLRIDTDAGTQTRLLHFGPAPAQAVAPTLQGYSSAAWHYSARAMLDLGGVGFVAGGGPQGRSGTLRVVTTGLLPGYLRKNGVPYGAGARLTEAFDRLTGAQNDAYLIDTAVLEDSEYLTQPFVRTYTFKKQSDGSGWDPTPCWPR